MSLLYSFQPIEYFNHATVVYFRLFRNDNNVVPMEWLVKRDGPGAPAPVWLTKLSPQPNISILRGG